MLATDWVTVSSIATAAATLVLAVATFASVRSANRAARVAERSLLVVLRPLLMPSRLDDPAQKVGFADDRWLVVPGSGAVCEVTPEAIYLAASMRNVGSGIAVMHGWLMHSDLSRDSRSASEPSAVDSFRHLTRDLYIAPGELAFWQGAFRDPGEEAFTEARRTIEERRRFGIELLYGDAELGRRAISLFSFNPRDDGGWLVSVARHWNVDGPAPR
jgi:hypothetical protein